MTDDKQDPSVVAWLWRVKGAEGWAVAETEARHHCEVSGTLDQFDWRPISLTSDLTAMKAELEEAKKALQFYADAWSFSTNKRYGGLEWKPKEELLDDCGNRAKAALSKPKPHDEGGLRSISEDGK